MGIPCTRVNKNNKELYKRLISLKGYDGKYYKIILIGKIHFHIKE